MYREAFVQWHIFYLDIETVAVFVCPGTAYVVSEVFAVPAVANLIGDVGRGC
jgi:hypothetical protein